MYDISSHARFTPYGDNPPNAPMLLDLNQKVDYLQRKLDEMEAKLNRVQVSLDGWDTWYYDWGWLLWRIRRWWLGTSSTDLYVDDKEVTMSTEVSETGEP